MRNEKVDIYTGKSVTVLVRLQACRKKSYLKTPINTSTGTLSRSKHCLILHLATKEN